jgi:hypothetical protein
MRSLDSIKCNKNFRNLYIRTKKLYLMKWRKKKELIMFNNKNESKNKKKSRNKEKKIIKAM